MANFFPQSTRFLHINESSKLCEDTVINVSPKGSLFIGKNVTVGAGVIIRVHAGATLILEDDVIVGAKASIESYLMILVGHRAILDDGVKICDFENTASDGALATRSGPIVAPVWVESFAHLGPNSLVGPGSYVGDNAVIAADSSIASFIEPGLESHIRHPPLRKAAVPQITIGLFGTSIMERYEGYATEIFDQNKLAPLGAQIRVEGHRKRGYAHALLRALQARWPWLNFQADNHAFGGATSRTLLEKIGHITAALPAQAYQLVFYACGINDIWFKHQGSSPNGVPLDEYCRNYDSSIALLQSKGRRVLCIGETPFGYGEFFGLPDIAVMNEDLLSYNHAAKKIAEKRGADFIDAWPLFHSHIRLNKRHETLPSPWSDGVHFSEHGDALMQYIILNYLYGKHVVESVLAYVALPIEEARLTYAPLRTLILGRIPTPASTFKPSILF